MNKKDQVKYNSWNEHLNNTRERANYSIRRMDLLLISICGAGIYIIFETLKEIKNKTLIVDNSQLLKYAGLIFLIAIISNFISQLTGYYANRYEEEFTNFELKRIEDRYNDDLRQVTDDNANRTEEEYTAIELKTLEGGHKDTARQDKVDNAVSFFNTSTNILNLISITSMFGGLIILSIFTFGLF